MAEYTSTREGFLRAMEWSLNGRPEDTAQYAEDTSLPTFYQVLNGQRIAYDDYVKNITEWRGKVDDFKPQIHEFLRDGDQLAARMTGTIKLDGTATEFESFLFAKVDQGTGKMEWLIERSVWGPIGGAPEHGVH
ncbi:hypothetical protein PG984_011510 [Apiospora sp. TS-2023a]